MLDVLDEARWATAREICRENSEAAMRFREMQREAAFALVRQSKVSSKRLRECFDRPQKFDQPSIQSTERSLNSEFSARPTS